MKRINKLIYHFILLGTMLLGIVSCKKEDEPDPCAELVKVSANFRMEEKIYSGDPRLPLDQQDRFWEVDTVLAGTSVFFTANQALESYEWKVGTDDRTWTTKTFALSFFNYLLQFPITIDIQLIGKRKPDTACFPKDDGIDTVRRRLVIVPMYQTPLLGEYEGFNMGESNDIFTVKIDFDTPENSFGIRNLNKGCGFKLYNEFGYYAFPIAPINSSSGNGCLAPEGWAYLNPKKDSLTIEYTMRNPTTPSTDQNRIKKTFKGKRKSN